MPQLVVITYSMGRTGFLYAGCSLKEIQSRISLVHLKTSGVAQTYRRFTESCQHKFRIITNINS